MKTLSIDELFMVLGSQLHRLWQHSDGTWSAKERYNDKDRKPITKWGNTPQIALEKLIEALKEADQLKTLDDWLIKGEYQ